MTKRRLTISSIAAALLAGIYLLPLAIPYNIRPIEVRVVNALTDRPVQGAVVAAQWWESGRLCLEGPCYRNNIRNVEVRTGVDGVARIPGCRIPRRGYEFLQKNQPILCIYKAGLKNAGRWHDDYLLSPPASISDAEMVAPMEGAGDLPGDWPSDRFPLLHAEIEANLALLPPASRARIRAERHQDHLRWSDLMRKSLP